MAGKQTKLAKLLKDARVAAGLSQTKAAQILGVERQTVGAWERGINGPLRERAVAVAKLYKIEVAKIDPFAQAAKIIDTVSSFRPRTLLRTITVRKKFIHTRNIVLPAIYYCGKHVFIDAANLSRRVLKPAPPIAADLGCSSS